MMFKKIRKYLVILMAVAMVASFAAIPVDACTLQGGYSDGVFPQGGGLYAYGAEAWAYCDDSPFWCYVNTNVGSDWVGGNPGGGTARANVYVSGFSSYAEAAANYITSAGYGCHC